MSLTRKAIREKIVDILTGETDAGNRVFPSRVVPIWKEEFPAILVYTAGDTRSIFSQPKTYAIDLQVRIEILHQGASGLDADLDDLASQVEYLLDQDYSLGGLVEDVTHTGTEITIDKEGEQLIGSVVLSMTCRYYRSSVSDPAFLDDLDRIDTDWLANGATTATFETHDTITGLSE